MSKQPPKGLTFEAILTRITTTVDGGWRITFDVPESEASDMLKISAIRHENLKVCVFTSDMIAESYGN